MVHTEGGNKGSAKAWQMLGKRLGLAKAWHRVGMALAWQRLGKGSAKAGHMLGKGLAWHSIGKRRARDWVRVLVVCVSLSV